MKHSRADYDPIQDPRGIIPEDEPVFLLRGCDMAAISAVKVWAMKAREIGADPEIIRLAYEQADRMERYQAERGGKVPDLPS